LSTLPFESLVPRINSPFIAETHSFPRQDELNQLADCLLPKGEYRFSNNPSSHFENSRRQQCNFNPLRNQYGRFRLTKGVGSGEKRESRPSLCHRGSKGA
jgi:hypothetical protein